MTTIELPERFAGIIAKSTSASLVFNAIRMTTAFVGNTDRKPPFFPEYTEHGLQHIQSVLESADYLIPPESFDVLTTEDISVLVIATLLHDLGMHISEDQFIQLVDANFSFQSIQGIVSPRWNQVWREYVFEAQNWDDATLQKLLGDQHQQGEDLSQIPKPLEMAGTPEKWTLQYRKFIGEFVRRHHARLAHEIAVHGIPLADGTVAPFANDDSARIMDIAGFVARSHSMPLRDTFPYLRSKHSSFVRCANVHPVFLMAVLRIADYIQVDNARTPGATRRVQMIRNQISAREWDIHESIHEVRKDDSDEQALFVVANPTNVRTFLNVQSLLFNIQRELDDTWATLGEVYSLQSGLRSLGLVIRRIKSTLDDVGEFQDRVDYIPRRFRFTSNTRLLQHLVGPLYGHRPEVAIRELLQNAIDAVREREFLECGTPTRDVNEPLIWVRVYRDDEVAWVDVEDRGIGMTADTINSYFLCAGASYRDSASWRNQYLEGSSPTVTRSGRFGVGALAAFLLGTTIHVVTRHLQESAAGALSFTATMGTDPIEIKRVSKQDVGTRIRVQISEEMYQKLQEHDGLEWDWYRWSWPIVRREIDGKAELPTLTRIPDPGAPLPEEWHLVKAAGYDEVIWTYGRAPRFVLNGINIGTSASSYGYNRAFRWEGDSMSFSPNWPFAVPYVSVRDSSARFPVDLQRSTIDQNRFPFAKELLDDITRDFAAFCLVFAPEKYPPLSEQNRWAALNRHYPGSSKGFYSNFHVGNWCFTTEGSVYVNRACLARLEVSRAILNVASRKRATLPSFQLNPEEAAFFGRINLSSQPETMIPYALAAMLCLETNTHISMSNFFDRADGAAIMLPVDLANKWFGFHNADCDLSTVSFEIRQYSGGIDVGIFSIGSVDLAQFDNQAAIELVAKEDAINGVIWGPRKSADTRDSSFHDQWESFFPHAVIPYDWTARRNQLSDTFELLAEYVSKWEAIQADMESGVEMRFYRRSDVNERL